LEKRTDRVERMEDFERGALGGLRLHRRRILEGLGFG